MDDVLTDAEVAGPPASRRVRQCAATRERKPPGDLIRFVAGPDGAVVPDLGARLPGRGVWVGNSRSAVEQAVKTKAFARSLRRQASASPALADEVDRLLERRALDALSLAKKSGAAVSGFSKVDEAVASGTTACLAHAHEAAAGGRGKLDRKLAAVNLARGKETRIADCFSSAQLSLAIGRSNVVHAALIDGGAAERFWAETLRLTRYRSASRPRPA